MSLIRVESLNGELVWKGTGYMGMSPGVTLVQTERRGNERRSRCLDLSGLLRAVPYTVHMGDFHLWIPFGPAVDPAVHIHLPDLMNVAWVLRIDLPPGDLRWIRSALEQPMLTPEEQETERERQGFGTAPHAQADGLDRLRDMARVLHDQVPSAWTRFRDVVADATCVIDHLRESGGPDPAHDDLIARTKAAFPYDPYDYGEIGPEGPSHWTPPEDPDEKVPSCPA